MGDVIQFHKQIEESQLVGFILEQEDLVAELVGMSVKFNSEVFSTYPHLFKQSPLLEGISTVLCAQYFKEVEIHRETNQWNVLDQGYSSKLSKSTERIKKDHKEIEQIQEELDGCDKQEEETKLWRRHDSLLKGISNTEQNIEKTTVRRKKVHKETKQNLEEIAQQSDQMYSYGLSLLPEYIREQGFFHRFDLTEVDVPEKPPQVPRHIFEKVHNLYQEGIAPRRIEIEEEMRKLSLLFNEETGLPLDKEKLWEHTLYGQKKRSWLTKKAIGIATTLLLGGSVLWSYVIPNNQETPDKRPTVYEAEKEEGVFELDPTQRVNIVDRGLYGTIPSYLFVEDLAKIPWVTGGRVSFRTYDKKWGGPVNVEVLNYGKQPRFGIHQIGNTKKKLWIKITETQKCFGLDGVVLSSSTHNDSIPDLIIRTYIGPGAPRGFKAIDVDPRTGNVMSVDPRDGNYRFERNELTGKTTLTKKQ